MEIVQGRGGFGEEVVINFGLDGVGSGFARHDCGGIISDLPPGKLSASCNIVCYVCQRPQRKDEARGERPVAMARNAESDPTEV